MTDPARVPPAVRRGRLGEHVRAEAVAEPVPDVFGFLGDQALAGEQPQQVVQLQPARRAGDVEQRGFDQFVQAHRDVVRFEPHRHGGEVDVEPGAGDEREATEHHPRQR